MCSTMDSNYHGIGIVGCGSIGRGIAFAVDRGEIAGTRIIALFDEDIKNAHELANQLGSVSKVFASFQSFVSLGSLSTVVESASQEAVRQYAGLILEAGKNLMVMSVGALLDDVLRKSLEQTASQKGARLLVSSGAIGGIDAIMAAKDYIEDVVLTTRKLPESLVDVVLDKPNIANLEHEEVVFSGSALEAVRRFPFNINVAATLSLAGIGPEKTRVIIVADPHAKGNVHEITVQGRSGNMRFVLENVPSEDNPKTSQLAILAALQTLRKLTQPGMTVGT